MNKIIPTSFMYFALLEIGFLFNLWTVDSFCPEVRFQHSFILCLLLFALSLSLSRFVSHKRSRFLSERSSFDGCLWVQLTLVQTVRVNQHLCALLSEANGLLLLLFDLKYIHSETGFSQLSDVHSRLWLLSS